MQGRDAEGLPFAFIKSIEFKVEGQTVEKQNFNPRAPFQCQIPGKPGKFMVTLGFHSHYGEPQLDIPVAANGGWDSVFLYPLISMFLYLQMLKWRLLSNTIRSLESGQFEGQMKM